MDDKGVIDPKKYATWARHHQDALRALPPEVQAKFANAASAGQAVAEATGAQVRALKEAQAGALGKVAALTTPQDVTRTVGTILRSSTAGRDMIELARTVKAAGGKEGIAGLRQAVTDHIKDMLIGNAEAGTSGINQIKADQFQTFMRTSRPALNVLFEPEEVASMEAIAQDIQRAKRSENATKLAGSPGTAQDLMAATLGKGAAKAGHGVGHATVTGVMDLAGMLVGHVAGEHLGVGGEVGMALGGFGTHVAQSMRAAGIKRVDDLVTTALLHPDVAKELLRKIPANASDATRRTLAMRLSRSLYRVLPAVGAASRARPAAN